MREEKVPLQPACKKNKNKKKRFPLKIREHPISYFFLFDKIEDPPPPPLTPSPPFLKQLSPLSGSHFANVAGWRRHFVLLLAKKWGKTITQGMKVLQT